MECMYNMYKTLFYVTHCACRCDHGVLRICFGEGDLEMYSSVVALSVEGWENERVLSLHEAAKLSNPLNEFHSDICKCCAQCRTNQCPNCRKKGTPCSSRCHGGRKCSNTHPATSVKSSDSVSLASSNPLLPAHP